MKSVRESAERHVLETAGWNGLDGARSSGQEIAGKSVLQCSAGHELENWVEWA